MFTLYIVLLSLALVGLEMVLVLLRLAMVSLDWVIAPLMLALMGLGRFLALLRLALVGLDGSLLYSGWQWWVRIRYLSQTDSGGSEQHSWEVGLKVCIRPK